MVPYQQDLMVSNNILAFFPSFIKGYFMSFHFIHNVSLYPLAYKQRCVLNMLIARIHLIFKFKRFNIYNTDVNLRVKALSKSVAVYLSKFQKPSTLSQGFQNPLRCSG